MEIFRVEHSTGGFGPYQTWAMKDAQRAGVISGRVSDRCRALANNMDDSHAWSPNHPTPARDYPVNARAKSSRWIEDHERCAFDSLDELRFWFEEFLTALDKCGYHIVVYKVDGRKIKRYAHQCVFALDDATVVKEMEVCAG